MLTTEEMDKETDVAMLENMAGNDTAAKVSRAAPFTSKVDMTRSFFAAKEDDGSISPRIVQITSEAEAKNPEPLTVMLKNGVL